MLGAGLLMATGGSGYDADAQAYIAAVETADGQSLETAVKNAINAFVVGCKGDGIWSAIKASCILAGARTLSGALVPLVGTAPTNNGFVSGDYDRKLGPLGNTSSKYLDSNRSNSADPQNNRHIAVYVTQHADRASTRAALGAYSGNAPGASGLLTTTTQRYYRINYTSNSTPQVNDSSTLSGFWGASRSTASTVIGRYSGSNISVSDNSSSPLASNTMIYSRGGTSNWSGRLGFYSIGESLDLALLDTQVTTLVNAIAAAIP